MGSPNIFGTQRPIFSVPPARGMMFFWYFSDNTPATAIISGWGGLGAGPGKETEKGPWCPSYLPLVLFFSPLAKKRGILLKLFLYCLLSSAEALAAFRTKLRDNKRESNNFMPTGHLSSSNFPFQSACCCPHFGVLRC